MATQITVASFQSACAAIADALIAQDFVTANIQYGVAQAILIGLTGTLGKVQKGTLTIEAMQRKLDELGSVLRQIRTDAAQPQDADMAVSSCDFSDTLR